MSSPVSPDYTAQHPLSLNRGGRAAEWFSVNARALGVVAAVIGVGVVGALGYRWDQAGKAARAETALYQAQASASANGDLRQVDQSLADVANRYAGTPSGAQAQLLLAQTLYDQGRFNDGIAVLRRGSPPAEFDNAVQLLLAAGYEGMGQGVAAAQIYERLSTTEDVAARRRNELRAAAARAYALGNDRASALRLWRDVLASGAAGLADEARVRIGELAAASG